VRNRLAVVGALASGVAIGLADSRPTWDDTGVTAFALLAAAGLLSYAAPRRAWLVALLVGVPTPLLERENKGAFAALAFAAVGGLGGWAIGRGTVTEALDGH
jgi:hypothetical protein